MTSVEQHDVNPSSPAVLRPGVWIRKQVGRPSYPAFVAVLAVLAGLLGSVYADDIKSSFPLVWGGPWVRWSWTATTFWISTFLFALLFFARQTHDDSARQRLAQTTDKINTTASQIEKFVQTLPPATFRSDLEALGRANRTLLETVAPRSLVASGGADSAVRSMLQAIAALAYVFDGAPQFNNKPARYAANVMMFIERAASPPYFGKDVMEKIKFFPETFSTEQLRGVLVLRKEFSATNTTGTSTDDAVEEIALPIPLSSQTDDGKYLVLPGAPLAFVSAGADGYTDSRDLGQWCRERGNFLPSMITELTDYFSENGAGKDSRSFLSKALVVSGEPFAVVNVHANRPDLLGPEVVRRDLFLQMIDPLVSDLAALLRLLQSVQS